MNCWPVAGLTDSRVQSEIRNEPVGRLETREITNRGNDRRRDGNIYPGNSHQPSDDRIIDRLNRNVVLNGLKFFAVIIELAQERVDTALFIDGNRLAGQPLATDTGKQVSMRARWHQVPREDRVDLVLQSGALAHEMISAHDQPSQLAGSVVSNPRLRQKICGEKLRQDPGIDFVSLHFRFCDGPRLSRVRHDHLGNKRSQQCCDCVPVRCRFQCDLVSRIERCGPRSKIFGLTPIRPSPRHNPSSMIAICANERCTSMSIVLTYWSSDSRWNLRSAGRKRQKRIRARSAIGPVAGAAKY